MLLIGLGNPGKEYEFTRHNAGKLFARYLQKHPVDGVEAVETECYMNESGTYIKNQISKIKNTDQKVKNYRWLIVAHDDLDLQFSSWKIQFGKGPQQHKGILSIENALGTTEFWRVRIGVEARSTKHEARNPETFMRPSGEEYVLERLSKDERKVLESLFPRIREQLRAVVRLI